MEAKDGISSEAESTCDSDSGSVSGSGNGAQRVLRWSKFVRNLYEMVACDDNAQAVGFSEDGLCLEIRNPTLLASQVLQKYFKHKNVSSFIRQLNNYGFKTIPVLMNSPVVHCFAHDYFRRGRMDLLEGVLRRGSAVSSKKTTEKLNGMKEREAENAKKLQQLKRQNEHLMQQNKALAEENKKLRTSWSVMQEAMLRASVKPDQQQRSKAPAPPPVIENSYPNIDLATSADMFTLPGGVWFADEM